MGFLALSSLLISCAAAWYPDPGEEKVPPLIPVLALMCFSMAELHYNPVMLAAISTDFPAHRVGAFIGAHIFLLGVGGSVPGFMVPLYQMFGPQKYFAYLVGVAVAAATALALATPCFNRAFRDPK